MLKNEWIEAENHRCSTRTYENKSLDKVHIDKILTMINKINEETGLNFQFVDDCSALFKGFKASYGLIKGATSCIALVGDRDMKNIKNKIGYYGEMLALDATTMGLGTCWVGGTYNKSECEKYLNIFNNEDLYCVICVGYISDKKSMLEKISGRMFKSKKKFDEVLISTDCEIPSWVESGINSVLKAPSAVNKKPVGYSYENGTISAFTTKENHGFEDVDLGISMLHFEIGAFSESHKGKWTYIDNKILYK